MRARKARIRRADTPARCDLSRMTAREESADAAIDAESHNGCHKQHYTPTSLPKRYLPPWRSDYPPCCREPQTPTSRRSGDANASGPAASSSHDERQKSSRCPVGQQGPNVNGASLKRSLGAQKRAFALWENPAGSKLTTETA